MLNLCAVDDVAEETQYAAAHENDSAPPDATSASDTVAPTDQAVDAELPDAIVDGGVASDADALTGSEWEEPDPTATADDGTIMTRSITHAHTRSITLTLTHSAAYAEAGPTDVEATTDPDAALAHTDWEQPSADPDAATTTTPADADTTATYPADDTTSYPTDDTTTYSTEAEEEPIVDAGSQVSN